MKKKVCMIGPDPTVKGGISTVVNGYLNSSLTEEFEITYVSSHIDGTRSDKLKQAVAAYLKFISLCLRKSMQIVHIHSSFGPSFYRKSIFIVIGKVFRLPVINHIHGAEFEAFYTHAGFVKRAIINKIYNLPQTTICLSDEWLERLALIVPSCKLIKIENFGLVPKELNLGNRENIVLFLGEVGKRKGAYDIPKVIEILSSQIDDIVFIIGGNGEIDKFNEIVKEKNLGKYVRTLGWVDNCEKVDLLQKSKVYFLPSYNEGMPMSILEGMAYGLPVVSTTIGGIPSLVHQGENGFIHEPGDILGFANSIKKLIENKVVYDKISQNNIRDISEKYNLSVNINKLKEIYYKTGDKNDNNNK